MVMTAVPSIVTPGRLAALIITAVTVAELVLIGTVLNPRTFFSGDAGVKYLQADALVRNRWHSLAVTEPGAAIDPESRFSALTSNQFARRGPSDPFYGAYSELFTVPVSVCLALFGLRGLYVVPLLAGVGTMILTYRLSARTAPRLAWLAPALIGACSPMFFYSVELWEHTLAVLCTTASVWLGVSATERSTAMRYALAGLLLGLGIAVREELYAMLVAGLVAVAWIERPRRIPAAFAAGVGALIGLVPHWLLKQIEVGRPARKSVMRVAEVAGVASVQPAEPLRAALWLIVPPWPVWVMTLALLIGVRAILPRLAPRQRPPLAVGLAAAIAAWATVGAGSVWGKWQRPDALIEAYWPALFLLIAGVPLASGRAHREIRMLLAVSAVFAATICVAALLANSTAPAGSEQWGPRYLLAAMPLLAAAIVFALERRREWAPRLGLPTGIVVATFCVLALAGLVVEGQGIRALRQAKLEYEQVVAATEAIDRQQVVVSDIWWFPMVVASIVQDRPVLAADVFTSGPTSDLLPILQTRGIRALTFVSSDGSSAAAAQALAAAGWTEVGRRAVRIWLEVRFVEYRRDGDVPAPAAARS